MNQKMFILGNSGWLSIMFSLFPKECKRVLVHIPSDSAFIHRASQLGAFMITQQHYSILAGAQQTDMSWCVLIFQQCMIWGNLGKAGCALSHWTTSDCFNRLPGQGVVAHSHPLPHDECLCFISVECLQPGKSFWNFEALPDEEPNLHILNFI